MMRKVKQKAFRVYHGRFVTTNFAWNCPLPKPLYIIKEIIIIIYYARRIKNDKSK